ncbi:hypothetical protein [Thalassotalea hakodatensis]|uniref:hypothetical protein n=1 Tax=Thalassotalea hakodatensis TaxID=3030492 RepID=UPI00257400EA|nr:hypothetical protein [Thalassotalea hakodatensis]
MSKEIIIKTVSPLYIPLSVTIGVDQSSTQYLELIQGIAASNEHCRAFNQPDVEHDYNTIDSDARDIRILTWHNASISPVVLHVFPNNVAIAELDMAFDASLTAEQISEQCQAQTKLEIDNVYQTFLAELKHLIPNDKNKMLRLNAMPEKADIHWIARFLMLENAQLKNTTIQQLIRTWLKDTQTPQDAEAIIRGERNYSITWLQYIIVDGSKTHEDLRVNTMVLAQYYYTAQENCNQLLKQAIDSAYNANNLAKTQEKLSFARVVTRLHLIDLHEHKKFLNRFKRKLLDDILASWDFNEVAANGQRMIEICSARLEESDNKRRERSTVMTDLLLVTLSFFAVFELSLYLTEFSREMMSRPALDYNDDNRSFFLEFIAEIDADIMFSFGFGLTFALVILYKVMKGK